MVRPLLSRFHAVAVAVLVLCSRAMLWLGLLTGAQSALAQVITWPNGCNTKTVCLNLNQCATGYAFFTEKPVSTCQAGAYLSYLYRLDLNSDGSIDMQAPIDTFQGNLPKGTHRLSWRVSDNCGNVSTCSYQVVVKDCQPPNLVCINGLTQPLTLPDCKATFQASQFILSLSDNCTPTNQIQIGIREEGTGTGFPSASSVTFDKCRKGFQGVEIWVQDQNGIPNICNSYVVIQENATECACITEADIAASGCIRTPSGKKVGELRMKTQVQSMHMGQSVTQGSFLSPFLDSCYQQTLASNLPVDIPYRVSITPYKNIAPLNGVSTYDLVLISKHILGLAPLPTLYDALAADVNRSNSVTTFDIVELRKLILGIYDTLPSTKSWRFVRPVPNPSQYTILEVAQDTFKAEIPLLTKDVSFPQIDFVAIKTGDLNNSVQLSASAPAEDRDAGHLSLLTEEVHFQGGETLIVPLRLEESAWISGWQVAATFNPDVLALEEVSGVPQENLHVTPSGDLRLLQYDAYSRYALPQESLFTLRFKTLQGGSLSGHFRLHSPSLPTELYEPNGTRRPLLLRFEAQSQPSSEILLAPPYPNPTTELLTFPLAVKETGELRIEIWNASGELCSQVLLPLQAGSLDYVLPADALPVAGLYVWRLTAGDQVYSGKVMRQ